MSGKDREVRITIHGAQHMAGEPTARDFMFSTISRHSHNNDEIVCSLQPRDKNGFLEWLMHCYKGKNASVPFTLGLIQRSSDSKMESHS